MKQRHFDEIVKNAKNVARNYRRRNWWAPVDDLEQEALLAQVDASSRFDPSIGVRFGAFTWRAAVQACHRLVLSASAPVSARHNPDVLVGLYREEYIDDAHVAGTDTAPDVLLDKAQFAAQIRSRLEVLVGEDGATFALSVLTGEFKPREVAEEHAVPVAEVYSAVRSIRETISSDTVLFDLWRQCE